MAIDFKLPDLGENIEGGDVVNVLVAAGDEVEKDQPLLEVETNKATVEVPSPAAGKILKVMVKAGDAIKVGQTLMSIDGIAPSAAPKPAPAPKAAPAPVPTPTSTSSRDNVADSPAPTPAPAPTTIPDPEPVSVPASSEHVAAGPATRRLARELGVDLNRVKGTGEGGRISREDVIAAVRQTAVAAPVLAAPAAVTPPGQDSADKWGPIRIDKLSKIRKTIALNMVNSTTVIPHVTNFDQADITKLELMRQSAKADYEAAGVKITTMPFVIRACALSLRRHPALNASIDVNAEQVVYKRYVNIGIAVDTERGLVVPNIRNADQLPIPQLCTTLATLADNVRHGKFTVDDLRGGTFTISNLGAVGGLWSTPVINHPEVAILLVGRSKKMPVVVEGDRIEPRLIMPLSLSYDHRLVDGAVAARFLNDVISFLENPNRLFLAP
ncbi:MAG: 2-oxo acid dehydrogenase subunit E2 [Phycisphaeraceae bacterium]|nr:2-oxo acid dehydrogenase subunit E2 [Phycisphaeraceae bacterium]